MKALFLCTLIAALSGILYLGSTNPPTTVKCDARGAIAVAVTKAKGC